MKPTPAKLARLLKSIAATRPEEIDCDEWLARVGRLVELMRQNAPVPEDLAPVLQHIEVCPECREEFDLLLEALSDTD